MGTYFPDTKPWSGDPSVGLGPLTPEMSLLIFIHYTWVWDQLILCICLSNQSQCGFFFNYIVVVLPFSLIFDSFEWWLLYSLVAILMLFCEEVNYVYLCCHLDWKSTQSTFYTVYDGSYLLFHLHIFARKVKQCSFIHLKLVEEKLNPTLT